ncbi:MAG: 50S ribosomal protein L19e [Candidatus Bilamarchaeaceae archaeon]
MSVDTIRRLAADILGVGEKRIRFDSEKMTEVTKAMTRADVRGLIEKKIITVKPKKGRLAKKPKRRRGSGSVRGSKDINRKKEWMEKIRSQRRLLRLLIELRALDKKNKRDVYMKIKGNAFRSKRAMLTYLKDSGLIPKDFALPKKGEQK